MKVHALILILLALILLAGCKPAEPVCPAGAIQLVDPATLKALPAADPSGSADIDIREKLVTFDQVVHGPLCNNNLSGKVYVACDIQIAEWQDAPNFLDGCDFNVEEGSVIYVAAHNNTPYYKGCASCHVGGGSTAP